MQAVMNLVWKHVLPSLKPGSLPADAEGRARLERAVTGRQVRPAQGTATPSDAARISGTTFQFEPNDQKVEAVRLEVGRGGETTLVTRSNGREQRIACGKGEWVKGRLAYGVFPEQPIAATGAWTAPDTFVAKVCFTETPFAITLTLRVAADQVAYDAEYNVFFGPTKQPQLIGRAGPATASGRASAP